jgi:hypothetical protein
MNENDCPLEAKVLEAQAGGSLDGDLAAHAQSCPICREALMVHRWMGEFRKESVAADLRERSLPDPEMLWTRAASPLPDEAVARKVLGPLRHFWMAASAALALLLLAAFTPLGRFLSSIPGWEALASSFKSVAKGAVRPFAVAILPAILGVLPLLLLILVTRFKPIRN